MTPCARCRVDATPELKEVFDEPPWAGLVEASYEDAKRCTKRDYFVLKAPWPGTAALICMYLRSV